MSELKHLICKVCGQTYASNISCCPTDQSKLAPLFDDSNQLIGKIIDNRYRIDSLLNQGGFSYIFKAYQFSTDRYVAIKFLKREIHSDVTVAQRFIREAKLIAKLTSPNTITVYESGVTEEGMLYIVVELLNGQSLSEVLKTTQLPIPLAIHIICQVCNSLEEAHETGIIHRDLKPSNIFILKQKRGMSHVKVLDFGIAKVLDKSQEGKMRLTQTEVVLGSPHYMSPEQIHKKRPVDHRTDIYSLGVIIYQLLTGTLPFRKEGKLMEVLLRHVNEKPLPFSLKRPDINCSKALEHLTMQCLEKDPEKRPPSVMEIQARLIEVAKKLSETQSYSKDPYIKKTLKFEKKGGDLDPLSIKTDDRATRKNILPVKIPLQEASDSCRPLIDTITAKEKESPASDTMINLETKDIQFVDESKAVISNISQSSTPQKEEATTTFKKDEIQPEQTQTTPFQSRKSKKPSKKLFYSFLLPLIGIGIALSLYFSLFYTKSIGQQHPGRGISGAISFSENITWAPDPVPIIKKTVKTKEIQLKIDKPIPLPPPRILPKSTPPAPFKPVQKNQESTPILD